MQCEPAIASCHLLRTVVGVHATKCRVAAASAAEWSRGIAAELLLLSLVLMHVVLTAADMDITQ